MEDYKPNSHKAKAEIAEKKVEKVVTGKVKIKKQSEGSKLRDIFVTEDVNNVKSYVLLEVLVPAIKKAVSDIVTNGIDMLLYGESGHSKKRSNSDNVSYRNYYEKRDDDRRRADARSSVGYRYDDVILDSRGEADRVLSGMEDLIERYGVVSVGDLYDLLGVAFNYTDQKYGWSSLRTAEVIRVRDGYKLKLPKALPID